MKKLGIIGGIAPESTVEYYRAIIELYRQRRSDGTYPPLIINSIDLSRIVELVTGNRLAELVDYIVPEIEALQRAGAEIALIASNTPHIVFPQIQKRSPLRLISIVESAAEHALKSGLKRVALFGTRFTMQADFYPMAFAERGIELITPKVDEQEYIHSHYMGELIHGVFLDSTRDAFLRIVKRLQEESSIDGLILGGTELPLILKSGTSHLPFLDTTRIHSEAAVERMLA